MRRKNKKGNLSFFFFSGFLFILIVFMTLSKTQNRDTIDAKQEYINNTTYLAVQIGKNYNLFPSVILAQSALESNYGKSELSQINNNYFGIKRGNSDNFVEYNTTEYINGEAKILNEAFRSYNNKQESFEDYAKLITKASRYESVRNAQNYAQACNNLQSSGYATDPNYAQKIISIIERYELYNLD